MNRNTNMHFSETPQINIKRSSFDMSHSHKTTINAGDVVPIFMDCDILPGDTVNMDMASLIRMATPIYPIMDNSYADFYWFFVPHRLVWDHWAEFWGQNDDPWIQQTEYEIPQIKPPANGYETGTIGDYMGVPIKVGGNGSFTALPFRAYCKVYNDFFRSENIQYNLHMYTDETTRTGSNGDNQITDCELGGKPAKACKFMDYFTGALPSPQKGQPVTIPMGTVAPIAGNATLTNPTAATTINGQGNKNVTTVNGLSVTPTEGMTWRSIGGSFDQGAAFAIGIGPRTTGTTVADAVTGTGNALTGNNNKIAPNNLAANVTGLTATTTLSGGSISINNMYADLSSATAATINQLRTAFAIQKYFENAALHGTRYIEYIKGVFGVTSSDARFQRAEYLGGKRVPLEVSQIIQTSSTDATSPQGNTAGFSCTIDRHSAFTKSFEEHGTLLGLVVIRTDRTYQQGLSRMWTRKKWLHHFNPFFAHLGEQMIANKELYWQGGTTQDEEAFGYQEAWAEYRYKNNRVSGYMRSKADQPLDAWHYADNYNTLPTLSPSWLEEPKENVDRTIAVTSALMHQYISDFYFKCTYSRPMPVYSVPGLIDHV